MKRAILISGFFTDDDWKVLAEALRKVERGHPEEMYQMITVDPNRSMEENLKFLKENFPAAPGVPFDVNAIKNG